MSLEFQPRFWRCEGPGNLHSGIVAFVLPSEHLPFEFFAGGNAAVQTLANQNGKFDFRHIEPTAMLGGKVKLKGILELMGTFRGEMS
jgi:hypothetical protein